jgi:hypothetical protein
MSYIYIENPNGDQAALQNDPLAGRSKGFRQFIAEEEANRQRAIAQVAAPLIAERQKLAAAYRELMAPVWRKPITELKRAWMNAKDTRDGLVPYFWNVLLRPDTERIVQDATEADALHAKFMRDILPVNGWVLSPAGAWRFSFFVTVQIQVGGNNVTEDNLWAWFNALKPCFDAAAGELAWDESRIVREPEPKRPTPSFDDIEKTKSVVTDDDHLLEGQAATQWIVNRLWAGEVQTVLIQWLDDMLKRFAFNPTESQMQEIKQFIESRNLDPRNPAHLDRVRVAFTRAGKFPERCLLDQELRSILLDKIDLASDRETTRLIRTAPIDVVRDWMKRTNTTIFG